MALSLVGCKISTAQNNFTGGFKAITQDDRIAPTATQHRESTSDALHRHLENEAGRTQTWKLCDFGRGTKPLCACVSCIKKGGQSSRGFGG